MTPELQPECRSIFTTEDIVRSGLMADTMRAKAYRDEIVLPRHPLAQFALNYGVLYVS